MLYLEHANHVSFSKTYLFVFFLGSVSNHTTLKFMCRDHKKINLIRVVYLKKATPCPQLTKLSTTSLPHPFTSVTQLTLRYYIYASLKHRVHCRHVEVALKQRDSICTCLLLEAAICMHVCMYVRIYVSNYHIASILCFYFGKNRLKSS